MEDLLKGASKTTPPETAAGFAAASQTEDAAFPAFSAADIDWQNVMDMELNDDAGFPMETPEDPGSAANDIPMSDGKTGFDLINLGMFEPLPPHEVLEELCVP